MTKKLDVGQTVWLKVNSGICRNGELSAKTIKSVGRKYFRIDGMPMDLFSIETLKSVDGYSSWYRVYLSEQDYRDEIEANNFYQPDHPETSQKV